MAKITTDLAGGETATSVKAKITAILQFWRGSTAMLGVTNWGQVRALLNGISDTGHQILNDETYASFVLDLNWLNNPDNVVPGVIFSSGREGIWLDPSDFASMFQDTAATVPVTAVGQSVALIRDKSGRGNHASQATASKRPVLARRPKTGLRNILPRNQWDAVPIGVMATDYIDRGQYLGGPISAYGISAEIVGKGVTDGISWVDVRYYGTNTAGTPQYRNIGSNLLHKIPVGATKVSISHWVQVVGGSLSSGVSTYQFLNGRDASFNTVGGMSTLFTPSATWQRYASPDLTISVNMVDAANYGMFVRFNAGATFDVTLRIGGGQVEYGSTVTALQNAASIYDLTEPGVQDCYGLMFDGVDDFLQTGNIAWATDEVTVTAGLRKLSDAALGAIVELGVGGANGTFSLASATGGLPNYRFLTQGTISSQAVSGTINAPNTAVISGVGDVSSDSATLRVNASQAAQSAADQGTGNYSTNPLYIGMRAGTSLPFNGILFGLTAVNAVLDATQLGMVELSTNFNTGGF